MTNRIYLVKISFDYGINHIKWFFFPINQQFSIKSHINFTNTEYKDYFQYKYLTDLTIPDGIFDCVYRSPLLQQQKWKN